MDLNLALFIIFILLVAIAFLVGQLAGAKEIAEQYLEELREFQAEATHWRKKATRTRENPFDLNNPSTKGPFSQE